MLSAQPDIKEERLLPTTRILFLFDASESMYGRWQSDLKINIARKLLTNVLDSIQGEKNLKVALRVYGHQKSYPPQHCNDTRLEVPFAKNNENRIKQKLKYINPSGTTPIAYSLEQAASDFPDCDNCRNIIVLLTDGIEECGGDPCEVSKRLQKKGIVLKPYVIGIGRNFKDAFDCVGEYFDASSEYAFQSALKAVITQAIKPTTAQVNLIDAYGKPITTNISMTFYDDFSGLVKHNFIHTLNERGLPDTLHLDPQTTYDITIHSIPPIHVEDQAIQSGQHTIISTEASMGTLKLVLEGRNRLSHNLQTIIRLRNTNETLYVQNIGESKDYLSGWYDLEILTLPRLTIDSVEIAPDHKTQVKIPMPGIAVIEKSVLGYGSLFIEKDNRLEHVYTLQKSKLSESLILQPGKYRAVFRSKFMKKSIYTVEKQFEINPGATQHVKLFRN